MSSERVLVVGTTSDYIDLIEKRHAGKVLFLTDSKERMRASEPAPALESELLADLDQPDSVLQSLGLHLDRYRIRPSGVACFDCESLSLAARIAESLSLPFVSEQAVKLSRNKFSAKVAWQAAAVGCPRAARGRDLADARAFLEASRSPIIIKPLTASGSELVFLCRDFKECFRAVRKLKGRLAQHTDLRLLPAGSSWDDADNAREFFVMEEYIQGREYSCDFIIDNGAVEIIRVAKKIPAVRQPVGTTIAYVVPAQLPVPLVRKSLSDLMLRAATALGIERSICMVDFIVSEGKIHLLEMTPRPGGDCLPPLIFQSSGLDMLSLTLDFAEGRQRAIPPLEEWRALVGLKLFARRSGVISKINAESLLNDHRVKEVRLRRGVGHQVILPPEDYDSWWLGYVIFQPSSSESIAEECSELSGKLKLSLETEPWVTAAME